MRGSRILLCRRKMSCFHTFVSKMITRNINCGQWHKIFSIQHGLTRILIEGEPKIASIPMQNLLDPRLDRLFRATMMRQTSLVIHWSRASYDAKKIFPKLTHLRKRSLRESRSSNWFQLNKLLELKPLSLVRNQNLVDKSLHDIQWNTNNDKISKEFHPGQ